MDVYEVIAVEKGGNIEEFLWMNSGYSLVGW